MRYLITLLSFSVFIPTLVAAPDWDANLRSVLEQAHSDFLTLSLDLPFEKVAGGREQTVRDRFKDATRTLMEAGREVGRDNAKSRELTRDALNKYRRVGLLLPFVAIDLPDEMMDKYIAAEDRLFFALKVFEGSEAPPQNEEVWRYNGQAWQALKGAYSLREAQEKCAAVMATQTTGWHVPSTEEIVSAFVAMKSPTQNPIFGTDAGAFREVWTGSPNSKSPGTYYYLDFRTVQWGVSGPLGSYRVLCVGKDGSGTSTPPVAEKPQPSAPITTELEGVWKSGCNGGLITTVGYRGGAFGIRKESFYDSDCTLPQVTRLAQGTFRSGKPADAPAGATKIDYLYHTFTATPMSNQEVAERNAKGECGLVTWQKGK